MDHFLTNFPEGVGKEQSCVAQHISLLSPSLYIDNSSDTLRYNTPASLIPYIASIDRFKDCTHLNSFSRAESVVLLSFFDDTVCYSPFVL